MAARFRSADITSAGMAAGMAAPLIALAARRPAVIANSDIISNLFSGSLLQWCLKR